MTNKLTHQSASTRTIISMIRLLAYIYEHQPTRDEACVYLEISQATFKRQIAAARFFGADVQAVTTKGLTTHYTVKQFGLFNKARVLAIVAT